jgi:hypothetical protein
MVVVGVKKERQFVLRSALADADHIEPVKTAVDA